MIPSQSSRTPFLRRLGYYLLGLGIGLMIVGLIVMSRRQFMAQRNAQPAPAVAPGQSPATPR